MRFNGQTEQPEQNIPVFSSPGQYYQASVLRAMTHTHQYISKTVQVKVQGREAKSKWPPCAFLRTEQFFEPKPSLKLL